MTKKQGDAIAQFRQLYDVMQSVPICWCRWVHACLGRSCALLRPILQCGLTQINSSAV